MHEIITTIGPSSFDKDIIESLKDAGATDFRINLSHSTKETLEKYFDLMESMGIKPALDTQGAQLRVSGCPKRTEYLENEIITISYNNNEDIQVNHAEAFKQINAGDRIKIDSRGLIVEIISVDNSI